MSTLSRTHVLIAESYDGGVPFTGGTTPLEQPANWVDWASMYDELNWVISVLGVTGTPTTWSLTARFQYRQMHAGQYYRYQTARWFDPSAENIASDVAEGVGWHGPGFDPPAPGASGTIATQATDLTNPLVVKRTLVRIPAGGVRVKLGLAATDGTSPKIKVGVEVQGVKR